MANEKNYFEFLDIPDGSGGTERWYATDEEAQQALADVPNTYATKNALIDATLIPVDLDSMTPSTTFVKNNILFINGVGYRASKDTTHFPVVLQVHNGRFVVDIVDGAPAYVVDDYTLNEDWEVWGDASVKRTLNQMEETLNERVLGLVQEATADFIAETEADQAAFISEAQTIVRGSVKLTDLVFNTAGTKSYTVQQVLRAVADLMDKVVVADDAPAE